MRRSRLVAREYATTKRDDTSTGAHTTNWLPLLHLQRQAEGQYKPLLAALDIKDAFLQVPQSERPHPGVFTQLSICLFEEPPGKALKLVLVLQELPGHQPRI